MGQIIRLRSGGAGADGDEELAVLDRFSLRPASIHRRDFLRLIADLRAARAELERLRAAIRE